MCDEQTEKNTNWIPKPKETDGTENTEIKTKNRRNMYGINRQQRKWITGRETDTTSNTDAKTKNRKYE